MKKRLAMAGMTMLLNAVVSFGQEHRPPVIYGGLNVADTAPHPQIPENAAWAQPLVIFILGMFVAAWIVGIVVRAIMPEEVPPTHAHDEHHGHRDPNDHPELHDPPGGHGHTAHGH